MASHQSNAREDEETANKGTETPLSDLNGRRSAVSGILKRSSRSASREDTGVEAEDNGGKPDIDSPCNELVNQAFQTSTICSKYTPPRDKRPAIRWDEEAIEKYDLERGQRQVIEEPKTPYWGPASSASLSSDDEAGLSSSSPVPDLLPVSLMLLLLDTCFIAVLEYMKILKIRIRVELKLLFAGPFISYSIRMELQMRRRVVKV